PWLDKLGNSTVATADGNWELTRWMPGAADFNQRPSTARLHDMMRQVAHFHNLTAEYSRHWAPSPGIAERLRELNIVAMLVPKMQLVVPPPSLAHPDLGSWFQRALGRLPTFIDRLIFTAPTDASADFCLQPVVRDLWHDHVLFDGESVSGLIDFHAMRVDTPLLDVARLVGSLKMDGEPPWNAALQVYSRFRELPNHADVWGRWLHACGVALAIVNWIKWISVEKRCFQDWPAVVRRINTLVLELERIDEE
ncbi:MAG TPA: phosphotransferase, partial [Pirellulaceae bacterium]|nr:phosphotransferase [Pirellulaceae bacterium]